MYLVALQNVCFKLKVLMSDQKTWWIEANGKHIGPFSIETVRSHLADSEVAPSTLACPVGGDEWKPLTDWTEFTVETETESEPPPPPPLPTKAKASNANQSQPEKTKPSGDDANTKQAALKQRLKSKHHQKKAKDRREKTPEMAPGAKDNADQFDSVEAEQSRKVNGGPKDNSNWIDEYMSDPQNLAKIRAKNPPTWWKKYDGWIGPVVVGAIVVLGTLIRFVGMWNMLWGLGWVVLAGMVIITLIIGTMASDELKERGKVGFTIATLFMAVFSFGLFSALWPGGATTLFQKSGSTSQENKTVDHRAVATMEYWVATRRHLANEGTGIDTRDEVVNLFQITASRIETMQTLNVDPIAVKWAHEAASSLRKVAFVLESASVEGGHLFIRSFLNGANGNIMGALEDTANTTERVGALRNMAIRELSLLESRLAHARSALTEKYQVQFP